MQVQDEAYAEPNVVDAIMSSWKTRLTEDERVKLSLMLLEGLPTQYLSFVISDLTSHIHTDIIRNLPYEISLKCIQGKVIVIMLKDLDFNKEIPCWNSANSERIHDSIVRGNKSESESEWLQMYINHTRLSNNWKSSKYQPSRVKTFAGHDDAVYSLQFDDKKMITGSRDRSIKIINLETFEQTKHLEGHEGSVLCLHFMDDMLITGSSDQTVRLWNINDDTNKVIGMHQESILNLKFDDKYLITSSKDRTIKVWDMQDIKSSLGEVSSVKTLTGHFAAVSQIMGFRNGRHSELVRTVQVDQAAFVTGSYDRSILVWDPRSNHYVHELSGHSSRVFKLQFDHRRLISGSQDNTIMEWSFSGGISNLFL
ncbi:WD40 repeat-like protein [Rozella allomycis CSF55]|uniref:WD40 repeat-like protein n=1 Tax=Rozella allomycis (strain CSF55) TaxID=988480 RepID=A0A4P9YP48_ROZAC|nr:WD40 repeat-like protein [Rozella allomycis CSF55]